MCVVNKQFELLEFVFDFVYVDLQYDEIFLTFTAWSVCLCGVCRRPWSVCEVVVVPYVDAVVAVTVVRVMLFVLHVWMHEFVGGMRGSCNASSTSDVLGVRGVGGVCEMCMCLARGGLGGDGGEWMGGWI